MNKVLKNGMRVCAASVLTLGLSLAAVVGGTNSAVASAAMTTTPSWNPFNFVLMDGTKKVDTRTSVSYADGKLTATGTDANGMGVIYNNEIELDGFTMNVDLNNWNVLSGDRWFGVTFTDVGQVSDTINEVPVYAKHSESWSNAYGAGVLFEIIPAEEGAQSGKVAIRFANIGIVGSVDPVTNTLKNNAGEYMDNQYTFARTWIEQIQLCNTDWTNKTNYDNIEISLKKVGDGYGFDINGGYWKRVNENINWAVDEQDDIVLDLLGIDKTARAGTNLTEEEQNKLLMGTAHDDSVIPYVNFGDPFTSLSKFEQNLDAANKRMYMRFMYQDQSSILSGDPASFTINSVNGVAASTGNETDIAADKNITGDISGTLTETSLHAGVYPSMVNSLIVEENTGKLKDAVVSNIQTTAGDKDYKVVNFKGKLANGNSVELVGRVAMTFNMQAYKNAALYEINGNDLIEVTGENGTVSVNTSSKTSYVLVYEAEEGEESEGGCGSSIAVGGLMIPVVLSLAGIAVFKRKNAQ